MTPHQTEFLDPMTWLERMELLVTGLSAGESMPDRHLRKAYHLIRLAPEMISRAFPEPVDEDTFEAMLAEEKYEPLAESLFAPKPAASPRPSSQSGADQALAMLAAWANGFVRPKALLS